MLVSHYFLIGGSICTYVPMLMMIHASFGQHRKAAFGRKYCCKYCIQIPNQCERGKRAPCVRFPSKLSHVAHVCIRMQTMRPILTPRPLPGVCNDHCDHHFRRIILLTSETNRRVPDCSIPDASGAQSASISKRCPVFVCKHIFTIGPTVRIMLAQSTYVVVVCILI